MADFDEWGGWSGGFDAGSYDPVDYGFGTPSFDYGGFNSTLQDPTADFQMPQFTQAGDVGPQQGQGSLGGIGGWFSQPQNLLGLAGAGAGLFGTLMGGGQGPTQQPVLGTAQRAALEQANAALAPFAQGQTPMQLQQQALLNALATGQGLPPGVRCAHRAGVSAPAWRSLRASYSGGAATWLP